MTKIRNILLIGRTGTGKSTLANVLVNKNGNFTKVFKESAGSTSETKSYQRESLEVNSKKYGVVDTIGLGDTKLEPREVYSRLAGAINEFFKQDGINRVIFTTDGRFTKEEINAFASLQLALFDDELVKHCTIVRTKFPEYADDEKCEEDTERLINENPQLRELIKSIGISNIIHIDIDQTYEGHEEDLKEINEKLWNYLKKFEADEYMPKGMEDLNKKIDQLLSEEKEKQGNLQSKIDGLKGEVEKEITNKVRLEKELEEARIRAEEERKRLEQELREKELLEKERKKLEKELLEKQENKRKEREKMERELAEANRRAEEARREAERAKREKEELDEKIKKKQGEVLEKHGDDSLRTFIEDYGRAIDIGIDSGRKAIPVVGGFVGGAIAFAAGLPFYGARFVKSLFW